MGQAITRCAAFLAIVATAFLAPRPIRLDDTRPAIFILAAALLLLIVQLVPLPPGLWQSLPGRELFAQADVLPADIWRPLAIVPDGAVNAAASLVVPAAVLILLAWMPAEDRALVPLMVLVVILMSMLLGVVQFSGIDFDNPLINDGNGQVSGSLANRNHFALFLAIGCVVAPVWAFGGQTRARWRGAAALGMILVLVLMILASGSRAGLLLGVVGVVLGLLIVRRRLRDDLRRAPKWAFPALLVAIGALIISLVFVSLSAGRADAIDRALSIDASDDLRARGLPTVIDALWIYFPAGSGFGSFDPVFRIREPLELLQTLYLNHAHNDFLEVALEGGLAGMVLLLVALGWWLLASVRAWRAGGRSEHATAKLGSSVLLLIFLASLVDYPARTPMIMAIVAIAAVWLNGGSSRSGRPALPA
ncbi:O-antigen ligase [Sphingomonas jejuensis]|uniref:O-antigen ligase n=1 Tax=Sphingomonas jejuensis TaxID=904715 RepID=A0ABX0XND6_9SPHN|nr:O-antigen ligase family protein [Sphingomonas jejuensis]NJC34886.1 O-antigen ligase [Sphingomonas jejuensis]